jgi:tetrathionate reductase subunit B
VSKDQDHDHEENASGPEETNSSRRDFIKKAGLGVAAGAGAAALSGEAEAQEPLAKILPEEHWRDRMKAPDDGKKFGWLVDVRRCFGCHGCEVACKAENDVPLGNFIRQTIYHDYEKKSGQMARVMIPMACQHCEDAPCLKACPCGALHKGSGGSVQVDYDLCSGHAACKDACPYGAIYIDPVANQAVKCHNCTHRVDVGMEPACVTTCPSDALYFGDLNDPNSKISQMTEVLEREAKLETLRPEKGTKPRMKYVVDDDRGTEVWEKRIPGEGQSYAPEAYDVMNWEPGEDGEDAK